MQQFLPSTLAWFSSAVGTPTPAQAEGWPAIASGRDALICAPTGSGKTLAAFLYFLDGFRRQKDAGALQNALSVLYISPLKALGNDIRENLTRPLTGLHLADAVRVGVRTGDTPESERRAMRKAPPHILITTPESLFLLLSSVSGREMLKTVKAVIVDEIHALLSEKRGAHLFLSLARLDALTGRHVQRVGLSATVKPLATAALHLSGGGDCAIIVPPADRRAEILVESPLPDMRDLPQRSIWPALADRVIEALDRARTVLVFADGRATCERLAQQINERAGTILARTHHGCVSKEQRLEAERMLRSGELRVMAATSSMELGIDVGEIDEVIQIGCPGSVAALLQRLGRAGHKPGLISRMRIFPRTAAEGLNCALTAAAAREGRIERAEPREMCLDVLAQHLISMAVAEEWTVSEAADVLRGAYPYRALTEETVSQVLSMLAGDLERADDHPARARLIYDRIHRRFWGDGYTRLLALSSSGTIPDRGWYAVTLPDGTHLGELDEEYVFEARLGDKFLLGAFAWRITDITHDRVIVAPDSPSGAASPFWKGDAMLRSWETGRFFGQCLETLDAALRRGEESLIRALMDLCMSRDAAWNTARVLIRQMAAVGALATHRTLILEHFTDETGQAQLMLHSPLGGRVNRALALLMMDAFGRENPDVRAYDDDDGVLFMFPGSEDAPEAPLCAIAPDQAAARVKALLPASAMFSIAFRYNAARAMLMGARSRQRQPLWIQRLRGAETLKSALAHPEHPLLTETLNECAFSFLDLSALQTVLSDIQTGQLRLFSVHTETPSPLTLALRRQAEADLMYVSPIPAAAFAVSAPAEPTLPPDPAALPESYVSSFRAESAERVHELLLIVGDVLAEELSAPLAFLEQLEAQGRAAYIDPGLWIAAENSGAYRRALEGDDESDFLAIVRRLARYAGAQTPESVAGRYATPPDRARKALDALVSSGALVLAGGEYIHAENYRLAQRRTVALRRQAIRTSPAPAFAALLAAHLRAPGSPARQLSAALTALAGEGHAPEAWEGHLLPARVSAYRPELLDAALARGEVVFRVQPLQTRSGGKGSVPAAATTDMPVRGLTPREKMRAATPAAGPAARVTVSFILPEDEGEAPLPAPEGLSVAQQAVYQALSRRGASFARTLQPYAGESGIADALRGLLLQGLVRADSFAPVRRLSGSQAASLRAQLRRRVQALDAGRWEAAREPRPLSAEEKLSRLFDRRLIACRETAGGDWMELLPLLRRLEYAGKVRRGYFVQGLSGAQFVREEDFSRLTYALSHPSDESCCLCTADPLQAWGLYLKHLPGREFTRLPSAAVVLRGGEPVCVWEKQGAELRVFDETCLPDAIAAFRDAFVSGAVFPAAVRVTLKRYPPDAVSALESAGFQREMLDYILTRR